MSIAWVNILRIVDVVKVRVTHIVAAISHDLRTPMTRLRLRLEAMEEGEHKRAALSDLEDLTQMVRSALDYIRTDSDQEVEQTFDVRSLLLSVCHDLNDTLGDVNFIDPGQCVLMGRALAVKRIFTNLIENAIRYGHQAQVELRCGQQSIEVSITDQGPGIGEEELDRVVRPFYRVEKSRNRHSGGIGLGLSVASTLIKQQGGTLTLSNQVPLGLRVVVNLPITMSPENSANNRSGLI